MTNGQSNSTNDNSDHANCELYSRSNGQALFRKPYRHQHCFKNIYISLHLLESIDDTSEDLVILTRMGLERSGWYFLSR